jgi:hypothetical protein
MIIRCYSRNVLLNMAVMHSWIRILLVLDIHTLILYAILSIITAFQEELHMSMTRWEPFRGLNTLQEQVNRLFEDTFTRTDSSQAELASWAPAVDIFETENELVVKADRRPRGK